jgi:capsular polysaccharide biosynthesis protein
MVLEPEHRQSVYALNGESGDTLSLQEIFRIISNGLWIIVIVVVVCVGMALGYSFAQTPTYETSSTILVGQRQQAGGSPNLGGDVAGLQQLTTTLVVAADSRPVAQEVIQRLNLRTTPEALLEDLDAQQIPDSLYIQISYKDPSPNRARLVADTAGEVLSKQISEVSPDVNAVTATVWESAVEPTAPVSPNIVLNVLLALAVGLALGLGLVFLLENLGVGAGRKGRYAEGRPGVRSSSGTADK